MKHKSSVRSHIKLPSILFKALLSCDMLFIKYMLGWGEWQGGGNWWMNETFFKKWHRFSFLLQFPQWNCLNAISIHHLAPWRDEHIKALFTVVNYEPHSGAGIGGWGWGSVNHKPIPLHLWLYLRYFSVEPLFVPSLWSFQRDIKRQQRVGFTPSGFDFSFHLRRLFHLFLCFVFFWSSHPQLVKQQPCAYEVAASRCVAMLLSLDLPKSWTCCPSHLPQVGIKTPNSEALWAERRDGILKVCVGVFMRCRGRGQSSTPAIFRATPGTPEETRCFT